MLIDDFLAIFDKTSLVQISSARLSRNHKDRDVTIVWCVDPRGHENEEYGVGAFQHFLTEEGYRAPDLLSDVGGAYRLCWPGRNERACLSSIRKSIKAHQKHKEVKELVLMMHSDCAFLWPEDRGRSNSDSDFPSEMFHRALKSLAKSLAIKLPGVQINVRCIWLDFSGTHEQGIIN
jgi:hypothetical protein